MRDFVTIEFQSTCNQEEVLAAFKAHLSNFQWRGGDSDMQGLYVSPSSHDSSICSKFDPEIHRRAKRASPRRPRGMHTAGLRYPQN